MRLLYCYIQFLDKEGNFIYYHGQKQVEMDFSTTFRFTYDAVENILQQKTRKNPLPVNFWTEENNQAEYQNIYNINVIAGDNGAGKTTAIRCILNLLDMFYAAADNAMTPSRSKRVQSISAHRALLLMENNNLLYLLNYVPDNWNADNPTEPRTIGFTKDQLRIYTCRSSEEFSRSSDPLKKQIASLLLKTKIIHMTNTLTQYDYECHIGEQVNRLRDYFIYDVSLGATIGSSISQFFVYDVYKQVKYVFDKDQAAKRQELQNKTDIFRSIMPSSLRIRLRIDQYKNDFPLIAGKEKSERSNTPLSTFLGMLCVSSFADNLGIRLSDGTFPVKGNPLSEYDTNDENIHNELTAIINKLKSRFDAAVRALSPSVRNEAITCISILPDKRIVSGSADGTLTIWNPFHNTPEKKHLDSVSFVINKHTSEITCLSFFPNDIRLVSGSADGIIQVWDTDSGKCLHTLSGNRTGKITCVIPLPDGHSIISNSSDGILRIWNTDTESSQELFNRQIADFADIGNVSCVTALPYTSFIVSGTTKGKILVYDYSNGHKRSMTDTHPEKITCIAALSNHKTFISCSIDGTIRMWNILGSNCLRSWKGYPKITAATASPGANGFVTGTSDGTMQFWSKTKKHCYLTSKTHTDEITCLTSLANGQIVSGSRDNTIRVYKPYTYGYTLLDEHNDAVNCLAVIPSGNQIVSGSADKSIHVLDVDHSELLFILQGYNNLMNNGLIGQLLRDEKNDNTSLLAAISNEQQKQETLSHAAALTENCLAYINYLYSEKGKPLISQFVNLDKNTFELPLYTLGETDDTYQKLSNFIQLYRYTCEHAYTIDFDWRLSSGQENMLRVFSNLYHIFDRDNNNNHCTDYTIYNNEHSTQDGSKKTKCNTLLLFLDEADLTLHPDWQRQLVAILVAYIPRIYPASCIQDIQLILSTHSPLLLGDIPNENITYLYSLENETQHLQKDGTESSDNKQSKNQSDSLIPEQTFGQNIHTILKDGFSLRKGTIGAFAAQKINNAAIRMNNIIKKSHYKKSNISILEKELQDIQPIINLVAPGVLKSKLEDLFQNAADSLKDENEKRLMQKKKVLQFLQSLPPEDQQYVIKSIDQGKQKNDKN